MSGEFVGGDDLARPFLLDRGLERRQVVGAAPAIVEEDALLALETAGLVGLGATTPSPLGVDLDADIVLDRLRGGDAAGGESVA